MKKITFIRLFLFSLFALMFLSSASAEPSASFAMKDLSGKTHRLADYKGKWVVLNYWAKWCPSCVDELPDLSSLYEKHKGKDLVVLGVAVDYKSEKEVRDFVDDMLLSYPIILSNSKIFAQFGSPEVLPTTLVFNPHGKLVQTKHGAITKQMIEAITLSSPNEKLETFTP